MKWKHPPLIKIYEALGAVADGRVEVSGNSAKVYSSSRNKFYSIEYDPSSKSIMVNDNGSFYKGYLGYPAIAFLMKVGALTYNSAIAEKLKGIAWKDINQKFKNDFDKTLEYILGGMTHEDRTAVEEEANRINVQLQSQRYDLLGTKIKPPEGY
jgi:hypothetical protein